jgi:hypothetical protein
MVVASRSRRSHAQCCRGAPGGCCRRKRETVDSAILAHDRRPHHPIGPSSSSPLDQPGVQKLEHVVVGRGAWATSRGQLHLRPSHPHRPPAQAGGDRQGHPCLWLPGDRHRLPGGLCPIPRAGPAARPPITSLQGAVAAADGWKRLLANPRGPVVAAAQGTGCSAPPMEAAATSPLRSPHELVTDSGRGSAGG